MSIPINLPQRANIQGFWKLDEESGTRYDETSNGNDLTDNATVLYGAGKIGNAADFERDNSEYLSITDVAQIGLDITGEITILGWINFETTNVGGQTICIAGKYVGDINKRCYLLGIDNAAKLISTLSVDGTTSTSALSTTALTSTGIWYHVGFTLNQTTDVIQCYVGGFADGDTVAFNTNINDTDAPFHIGAYGEVTRFFDGLIDEVIIWNKCLTAAEVLQVKNITAYRYGGRFMPFFMSMREAYERHDKLWTPKGILIPEGI